MNLDRWDVFDFLDNVSNCLIDEGTHPKKGYSLSQTVIYLLESIDSELQKQNTVVDFEAVLRILRDNINKRLEKGEW